MRELLKNKSPTWYHSLGDVSWIVFSILNRGGVVCVRFVF